MNGRSMMATAIDALSTLHAGAPEMLFEGDFEVWYDVLPGGNGFIMLESKPVVLSQLKLVVNWATEFE